MKKILFTLLAVLAISSFCSAQLPSVRADETKTFIGTIESFRPAFARPPKWPIARFTAVADNGEKIEVYVLGRDTTVIDVDGESIENKRPQVGKKVEIKYTAGEHEIYGGMRYEAISIRYVPADYVQQPTTPATPGRTASELAPQLKDTLIGRVENITAIAPGLLNGWTYCKITIITDTGEKPTVFVTTNTKLSNAEGITNPPLPKEGERVEVKYSTTEKGAIATSIKYLPNPQPIGGIGSSSKGTHLEQVRPFRT